jgi:GGDEF domain-containing protein
LQAAIDAHNAAGVRPFTLSCTVGVVTRAPSDDLTVVDLLSQADNDMYDNRQPHGPLEVSAASRGAVRRPAV